MRGKLLTLATVLSLALCLATAALWRRARTNTDVFMVALPGGKCLLINSHEGRWLQITGLRDWPDRGVRVWSAERYAGAIPANTSLGRIGTIPFGNSWQRAGPFLFWQRHSVVNKSGVTFVHGALAVPADDAGKLPAYGDGYDRAFMDEFWSGVRPQQKGWLFLSGWEVRFPDTYLMAVAGALPLVVIPVWLMRLARRLRRPKQGLCASCGYDIRASSDRCPECGRAIPPATNPAGTTPAGTALAATAP